MQLLITTSLMLAAVLVNAGEDVAQREANQASPDHSETLVEGSMTSNVPSVTLSLTSAETLKTATPESRQERIKRQAKVIYGRGKEKVVSRASYYLVDYALSLKAIAMLYANQTVNAATNNTFQSEQPGGGASLLFESDKPVLVSAMHSFLQPLVTYQAAQKNEDEEKLSSSLIGMLDILLEKTGGETHINDADYTPGQLWTNVLRRKHVDQVLKGRDAIFQSRHSYYTDAVKAEDKGRLQKIREYYSMLSPTSSKFTKLIHQKLDLRLFGERYLEVVENVLLKKPEMVRKCRVYLAKYLQTGNRNDAHYKNLLAEAANSPVQSIGHMNHHFSLLLFIIPVVISISIMLY